MTVYQLISAKSTDEEGNIIEYTLQQKIINKIVSTLYSLMIIVYGEVYSKFSRLKTDSENHRYQKDYEDAYILRVFLFNGLNYYLPLMFIAFDPRNPNSHGDLFVLLLTQLAGK